MKNYFFIVALVLASACQQEYQQETEQETPNILLIFIDDLGYGDLGIHGNSGVRTPNIDRFAREAVRIEPFYAQPVCAPSRAQILTGRHFLKTGIWHVYEERAHLNPAETILTEILKRKGYYTAFIGKWTLGRHGPYLPENRGFDDSWRQALEVPGNIYQHQDPVVNINGTITEMNGWAVELYTDFALQAIENARGKPFFIELAHISTHEPYFAPDSLVNRYMNEGYSISMATFYAMVEHLDRQTGRLLNELEKRELADNTLVIFTSDNGPIGNCRNLPHLTEEEMAHRNPLRLRGRKGSVFENGIRVPGFFRWPGKFPPRIINESCDLADIFPTIAELAGISIPEDNLTVYGQSLVSLLSGEADSVPDRYLYFGNHQVNWEGREDESGYVHDREDFLFEGTNLAIRKGNFKYVQFARGDEYGTKEQFSALFNLENDLQEKKDISNEYPEMRIELEGELRRWWEVEVIERSKSYGLPTYFLGYEEETEVEVHVGSAVNLYGDVDYRAVNWILGLTDWTGVGAGVDYNINVLKKGTYEVLINLTPGPVPCLLEIQFGNQVFSQKIQPDQVLENESFGKFQLKTGETHLMFRMMDLKNPSVAGIKSLDKILIRKI